MFYQQGENRCTFDQSKVLKKFALFRVFNLYEVLPETGKIL